jgi:hypothetical protein
MPHYAMIIYATRSDGSTTTDDGARAEHDRHAQELEDSGSMIAAFALEPSSTATSIRGATLTDGPFIEAKEVIAGFAIFEAADLDAALAIGRANPATWQGGGVEIRPVESFGIMDRAAT